MGALYGEIARSIQISDNFAGGKKHRTERESIDDSRSGRSIKFQTSKWLVKQQGFLSRIECTAAKVKFCLDDDRPTLQSL
jgi:hypothetical protein